MAEIQIAPQEPAVRVTRSPLRGLTGLALAGASTAALLGVYAYAIEPLNIEFACVEMQINAPGRLPARGLRILQLADSHFCGGNRTARERKKIDRIRRLVDGLEYDLLIHTGDFIHYDSGLELVRELLAAVPAPRLGRYAVYGNHDYTHYNMLVTLPRMWRTFQNLETARNRGANPLGRVTLAASRLPRFVWYVRNTPLDGKPIGANDTDALSALLQEMDYQVLHNRSVHVIDPSLPLDIYLAGIDDLGQGTPHLADALAAIPAGEPAVLLSHNPDIIAHPALDRVDAVISGHTHGGQLQVPFWGPAHTQSAHLSRAQVSGQFSRGHTQFYVSRGIGEGIPLRFRTRPQVTLITLYG
ncbi:MAG: metallophosphoesterase [Anaerolineales bacterium]|nr:metallophosphoesterase [Anaerolineales bacterium]